MSGFLPKTMHVDSCNMETLAEEFLIRNNIKDLVSGFSHIDIDVSDRQFLRWAVRTERFVPDSVEGEVTFQATLEKLGHLSSLCAWNMQEHWRRGVGKQVQNHRNYVHIRDPLPGEMVHMMARANTTSIGTHYLSFTVETFINCKPVLIAQGHSSLAIIPPPPMPQSQHPPPADSRQASSASSTRRLGSSHSTQSPLPSSDHQQPSGAAQQSETPGAQSTSSGAPPSTLPPILEPCESPMEMEAAAPTPPMIERRPSSILRKRRHVSYGMSDDQQTDYMLVNVETVRPDQNEMLMSMMRRIGVEPTKISHQPMPISTPHRFVFYFSVTTENERSKMENVIELRYWQRLFKVDELIKENAAAFFSQHSPWLTSSKRFF